MTQLNTKRTPLFAGNWKLNVLPSQTKKLIQELSASIKPSSEFEVAVCPVFVCLPTANDALKGTGLKLGAQDVYQEKEGAFTGEVSSEFLKDVGCEYVIIGHSERRQFFSETDESVNKKTKAVQTAGLIPITCVGETLQERESNQTFKVIEKQIRDGLKGLDAAKPLVIAYEPVWAIGTGKTATPAQANEVHVFIRKLLEQIFSADVATKTRILYGGSVKPENSAELMSQSDIDGALVGGASLKADSFSKIIYSAHPVKA
jgi:triosephosphate isomerase